jgi:UDP-N-acetylmuramate--alanine ligase
VKLEQYRYIYFLGIGGIGMSALARWFKAKGFAVGGYDRTPTPLTEALVAEGIAVHFTDDVILIPAEVRQHKSETLVILTPAVPAEHPQLQFFRSEGYDLRKRSQVLGLITNSSYTVAVAGTHGKTTTSSMVAHLLHASGVRCSAFLGGISVNLNSNLLIGGEQSGEDTVVVEADEYDRSFLTLHPNVAIVTSADADHLDIYGHHEALTDSFRTFIGQIRPNGYLLLHRDVAAKLAPAADVSVKVIRYGLATGGEAPVEEEATASITAIAGNRFRFDLRSPFGEVTDLELGMPGFHNVENALAAALVAQILRVNPEQIRAAMASYRGVKRRFEYVWEGTGQVYIDDYAHHPSEINAFLRSLRALYPDKRLKVIFQPHLFTRTRDFAEGFAESLSQADELVMLDIYPAREKPIPGVTAHTILDQVTTPRKSLRTKAQVLEELTQNRGFEVLATIGAGDIDTLAAPIKNILENRTHELES